jgi:hypothetical protein
MFELHIDTGWDQQRYFYRPWVLIDHGEVNPENHTWVKIVSGKVR